VPETVRDDVTGFLVEPGNANQAATRWLQLLEDSQRRQRMGTAGRELVANDWSLDNMVTGYEQLICEIYNTKLATRVGQVSNLPDLSRCEFPR
jgi:glycosyltransferase involved in cell wall biosynthesis